MGVSDAAAFLAKHNISGAPVTDSGGKISGVVSEKDFLRKMGFDIEPSFMGVISRCLNTSGCMVSGLRNILLSELVSSPAVTVLEDASVSEVSSVFIEKSINRIPVCDINGLPVGIVTRSDLVNAICLQG
jgi:CBS domain-containing protein